MQVSALNLIIAAQQARSSAPPRPASQTKAPEIQTAAASEASSDFAPLAFKAQTDPQQPAKSAAPQGYSPSAPLGSQVDIRV